MAGWILERCTGSSDGPALPKKKSKPLGYAKSYGTRKSGRALDEAEVRTRIGLRWPWR